jgi:dolichol kinase
VTREDRRQVLHLAMAAFALTLRWLGPWQALALAGSAIAMNWVVMPLTGLDRHLRRPGAPFVDGVKLYPIAVLAVLLLFPAPVAAAAWAVMGAGDGASNLVGRRFGRPPFLDRADRSLAGTIAFVAAAWPAAWGVHAFVADSAGSPLPALAAAVAGAAAELLPLPWGLDDNLPIALAAGAVFAALA